MVLNLHSDASYLSEIGAKSRMAGQYFLKSVPQKDKPDALDGAIYVSYGILKIVVALGGCAWIQSLMKN